MALQGHDIVKRLMVAPVVGCFTVAACWPTWVCAAQRPYVSATVAVAEESVGFGMLEARFDISDAWLVSAAAAYLDPGSAGDETQLRLSAIGTLRFASWSLENRHLFSFSSASSERYRMRVRVIRSGFGSALSVRAFHEVFFDLDRARLFRNNFAAGFGVQISGALSGELYQVWETNRSRGDNSYVLALLSFRFDRTQAR